MGDDEVLGRPPLPQPTGILGNRFLVAGVAIGSVIFVILALFLLRFSLRPQGEEFTKILSYLSAKEASEATTELKILKIPYKLEDKGGTILVPKGKADEARLGLANKNLPRGGVVGFEIFDKTGLGTTDFDRRIKFIRAISGELSRNISLIEGVEEARVQIVIPETQLFVGKQSPVTASVLLRIKPNHNLLAEQVNGIVHLVASSVEDLSPENVTVVDINGFVLTSKSGAAKIPAQKITEIPSEILGEQTVVESTATSKTALHEDIIDQLNYKDELERRLTDKAQEVLNKFYLQDKARVWVNVELGPSKKPSLAVAKPGFEAPIPWQINKINSVILISDTGPWTEKKVPFENIKNDTFSLVSTAVGYNKIRGDKIEMRRVPFTEMVPETSRLQPTEITQEVSIKAGAASTGPAGLKPAEPSETKKKTGFLLGLTGLLLEWFNFLFSSSAPLTFKFLAFFMMAVIIGAAVWFFVFRKRIKKEEEIKIGRENGVSEAGLNLDSIPEVQKIREAAASQPEKLASVLKNWLSEEQGGG